MANRFVLNEKIGVQGFLVDTTPSKLFTSANSGFLSIIPTAFL